MGGDSPSARATPEHIIPYHRYQTTHSSSSNCKSRGVSLLLWRAVCSTVPPVIRAVPSLYQIPQRALSAPGSFGDGCNTSCPKLRSLLVVCQLTPSDIVATKWVDHTACCRQGTTISAQSTGDGLIGDGLTSPKEGKAELKVGAICLERARPESTGCRSCQLRSRRNATHLISSHLTPSPHIAPQCSAVHCNSLRRRRGCGCGHRAKGHGNVVLAARDTVTLFQLRRFDQTIINQVLLSVATSRCNSTWKLARSILQVTKTPATTVRWSRKASQRRLGRVIHHLMIWTCSSPRIITAGCMTAT